MNLLEVWGEVSVHTRMLLVIEVEEGFDDRMGGGMLRLLAAIIMLPELPELLAVELVELPEVGSGQLPLLIMDHLGEVRDHAALDLAEFHTLAGGGMLCLQRQCLLRGQLHQHAVGWVFVVADPAHAEHYFFVQVRGN